MESHNQQQLANLRLSDDDGKRDWASLPLDLLKICLEALRDDQGARRAALASCKLLCRAVVRTSPHDLRLDVDRRAPFRTSTRLWRELWGDHQPQQEGYAVLALLSQRRGSPERCLRQLRAAGERLPFVTRLYLQGLALDALIPDGVSALLPNLQRLTVEECELTPAARTTLLDAGCSRMRTLALYALSAQQQAPGPAPGLQQLATAQLRQLAKLPALSSIVFLDASCPTLFLVALGTQLTSLTLNPGYQGDVLGGLLGAAPANPPAWSATLQHVARCTRLTELTIPCDSAEELRVVAPALQQLRSLELTGAPRAMVDGDAMVEALLALPHLTSLSWDNCSTHTFRRSFADSQQSPCRWEELYVGTVAAHQLANLPMHSLTRPVWWANLMVHRTTTLRDVRAAVANVTRRCPAGFRWAERFQSPQQLSFLGTGVDVPAVLRLLQPLFAPLASVEVLGLFWDAGLVKALGEALPRSCTALRLRMGGVGREGLEQVARSLPWLRRLELAQVDVASEAVLAYARMARRLAEQGGAGGRRVRLPEVVVEGPTRVRWLEQSSASGVRRGWEQAVKAARQEGVALKVVW